MFAFHGYGMDAGQFRVLEKSFCQSHKILAFELPYHRNGCDDHEGWVDSVIKTIDAVLGERGVEKFALTGYSIGSKIALRVFQAFQSQVDEITLFAPYGIEDHWGLRFVTGSFGNSVFRAIAKTRLPESVIRQAALTGVIDADLHEIIGREMDTKSKRINLCNTLKMIGEIKMGKSVLEQLHAQSVKLSLVYGEYDVLLPYSRKTEEALKKIAERRVIVAPAGHWMMTSEMDDVLSRQTALA
ncbi:MAG: alpha/beta hydrolase [Cyclobacteriaceae bacterium]